MNLRPVENIFTPNSVFHNSRSIWLDNGDGTFRFLGKIDFSVAGTDKIKNAFDQQVYSITTYFDDLDTRRWTTVMDDVKNNYYSPKILLWGLNGFLGNGTAMELPSTHLHNSDAYSLAFFLNHIVGNSTNALQYKDKPILIETTKNNEPLLFLPTARIQIIKELPTVAQRHAQLKEWYCVPQIGYHYTFGKQFFDANQLTLEKFRC